MYTSRLKDCWHYLAKATPRRLPTGNLHLTIDGDIDGDPHWSTGLSPQDPNEEQKEGEHEKRNQDREGVRSPSDTRGLIE